MYFYFISNLIINCNNEMFNFISNSVDLGSLKMSRFCELISSLLETFNFNFYWNNFRF